MSSATTAAKTPARAIRKRAPRRSLARFIRVLQKRLPAINAEYHVKSFGVFGSYVRYEEKPRSDLDVLVEFAAGYSFSDKIALKETLSKLLGVKVDVVNRESLPPFISRRVLRQVIWLQKDGAAQSGKLPRKPRRANGRGNGANMEPKREYLDYL